MNRRSLRIYSARLSWDGQINLLRGAQGSDHGSLSVHVFELPTSRLTACYDLVAWTRREIPTLHGLPPKMFI